MGIFSRTLKEPEWVEARLPDPLDNKQLLLAAQATAYSNMPANIAAMSHYLVAYVNSAQLTKNKTASETRAQAVKAKLEKAELAVLPPDGKFEQRWREFYFPWIGHYVQKCKAHGIFK